MGPLTAGEGGRFVVDKSQGLIQAVYQNPVSLYIAIGCFTVFTVVLCVALWRLWKNRTPKFLKKEFHRSIANEVSGDRW